MNIFRNFASIRAPLVLMTTASTCLGNVTTPAGAISTDRTIVLANSSVKVDWIAIYPTPPTNPPKFTVRADVRVIGAAFGPTNKPYPVRAWARTSATTGWAQIFFGNSKTNNPQTIVWSKILAPNERLDFRFQGAHDDNYNTRTFSGIDNWQTAIDTTPTSPNPWNRMVFVDDEIVPNFNPAFDQKDVHAHLAAYFETGSRKLKLGPNDFIYLTELSSFRQGHESTDLQDLVLLVTFTQINTP